PAGRGEAAARRRPALHLRRDDVRPRPGPGHGGGRSADPARAVGPLRRRPGGAGPVPGGQGLTRPEDHLMSSRHAAAVLVLALARPAPAEPGKAEPAWKPLFDGKSLDGWKATDFYGAGEAQVKDGTIVLNRGKLMTGVTYARGDFPKTDYEVTL